MRRAYFNTLPSALLALVLAVVLALSVVSLGACALINKAAETSGDSAQQIAFDNLAEQLFAYEVSLDFVEFNQMVEDPAKLGLDTPQPKFEDYTFAAYRADDDYYRAFLVDLESHSYDALTAAQQGVYDIIKQQITLTLELENFYYYSEPLEPSMGAHANLPIALINYNFRTRADIDLYLALLADTPRYFTQLADHEREKQKLGLLMSAEAMETVLTEVKSFTGNAQKHMLTSFFNDKLASSLEPFVSLTTAEKQEYQALNLKAMSEAVIPAYSQLHDELKAIAPACNSGTSLASHERGRAYYELLMQTLGFAQTPRAAAETLDKKLAAYHAILTKPDAQYSQSVEDLDTALVNVPDEPDKMLAYLQQKSANQFVIPEPIEYQVKQVPAEAPNDVAAAFFIIPPVDNPQQNVIYYYPNNVDDKADLFRTMAHEGIPGHMYQTSETAKRQPANIEKLLMSTAYMEGWAMYAENESFGFLGMPATSVAAQSAYDKFEYGLRARVDIGVNYEGWNLTDTKNYLRKWQMEDACQDYYDLAAQIPTAYLPYGLGVIVFDELRARAEAELGGAFDPTAYHQKIIEYGGYPFTILEPRLNTWLQNK